MITKSICFFDKDKSYSFLLGIINVFVLSNIVSIRYEYLVGVPKVNIKTQFKEMLPNKHIILFSTSLITWILSLLYNKITSQKINCQNTNISNKRSIISGILVYLSLITYSQGLIRTSHQTAVAFKSLNFLSVLLIGIYFTRVKQKTQRIGVGKLYTGMALLIGVIFFFYFDPNRDDIIIGRVYKINGIIFLIISSIIDGFLYDILTSIKLESKPTPTQMLEHVNKWVFVFSLCFMMISSDARSSIYFTYYHSQFAFELLIYTLVSFATEVFIYKMVIQFSQHIAPYVIATHRILKLFCTLIYYNHQVSKYQVFGFIFVFCIVIYEFCLELKRKQKQSQFVIFKQQLKQLMQKQKK